MDDHYQRRAFRKTTVNTVVYFFCIALTRGVGVLEDGALAFTISSVSITVAAGVGMMTVAWILYFEYLSGDLGDGDYDPIPLGALAKGAAIGLLGKLRTRARSPQ
jgi:hypothetical protein